MPEEDKSLRWYHLSVCRGMNVNHFYEDYERDSIFAGIMDSICLACPVRSLCLEEGLDGGEDGLWGGVYLTNGRVDVDKNNHKTESIWNQIGPIE